MLIPVSIGFIIVLIFVVLGFGYTIASNITSLMVGIYAIIMFFTGLGVVYLDIKSEKSHIWFITALLHGLTISVICFFIALALDTGNGYEGDSARYILFGEFEKIDLHLATILISTILIIILSIFVQISKTTKSKKISSVFQLVTIFSVILIFVGGFKIAEKDAFLNSKSCFDFEKPNCIVLNNTTSYTNFEPGIFVPSQKFKKGIKLYTSDHIHTKNNIRYILVSDGKRMGYVKEMDLTCNP